MNRFLILVGTLTALAAAAVATAATGAWSPPRVLARKANNAVTGIRATRGGLVAAWAGPTGVYAAVANRRHVFGRPTRLSRRAIWNDTDPILATDRRGDAIVMWQNQYRPDHPSSPGSLFVSFRRSGGRFTRVHRLARSVGGAVVGMDASGNTTIAWDQLHPHGANNTINVVVRRANGSYGHVEELVQRGGLASLAVNARGDAILLWVAGAQAQPAIMATTRTGYGPFSAPVTVASSQDSGWAPEAAIDRAGNSLIAWDGPYDQTLPGNSPYRYMQVTSLGLGADHIGSVTRLRTPNLGAPDNRWPVLSGDSAGDAVLAWENQTRVGNRDVLLVSRRRAGGDFGRPRKLANQIFGSNFDASIGPAGAAIVAWDGWNTVQAAIAPNPKRRLRRVSQFASRKDFSVEPAVTIDSRGVATVVWQDSGPINSSGGRASTPLLYSTGR